MAISAGQLVSVNPRLLQPGGTDLELNGLILTKNRGILLDPFVMAFSDPASVAAFFGSNSEEYALSNVYFLGYNNSFIKPRALYFAPRVDIPLVPFLRGSKVTTSLAELNQIISGSLTISIGSTTDTVPNLDFGTATSYSDIAVILQAGIRDLVGGGLEWTQATVSYSSQFSAYVINGGVAGDGTRISTASLDVAEALFLTETQGALASSGSKALTPSENLNKILDYTQNWVPFTTIYEADDAEHTELALWANSKGVAYLYIGWSSEIALTQQGNINNIATTLSTLEVGSSALCWLEAKYAVFILACCASVDFDRRDGTITTAFKSQEGLAATVNTTSISLALNDKNVNFYGNYATRNDNFVFTYPGCMFGTYGYIDTYINAVWLNNALQVALMNGLGQANRVPYTRSGYSLVRSWMQDPILRGVKSGIIDGGVLLSEAQKAQVMREAGKNIIPQLERDGYYVQVENSSASARVTRDSPTVNFWYTYGGSIHRLVVASTAVV